MASRHPVHVTARLEAGLPSLRRARTIRRLRRAFAAGCTGGRSSARGRFRLVHFSVQSNHLHLLVEGADQEAVARGLQGLFVRVAKALNGLWGRRGSVFADRYHDRVLRTPWEVRRALAYVLHNSRKHGETVRPFDGCSSGFWFDGWREVARAEAHPGRARAGPPPVAEARTWLLREGWRRHGRVSLAEVPARG